MFAVKQSTRSSIFSQLTAAAAVCTVLALSACGGGGGGGDAPGARPSSDGSADVYMGTWLSACIPVDGDSGRLKAVVTRQSANVAQVAQSVQVYAKTTTCSGAILDTVPLTVETFNLSGNKTIDGKQVDKVVVTDSSGSSTKLLAYTDGRTLWLGDEDSAPDIEGYPTALDLVNTFARQ